MRKQKRQYVGQFAPYGGAAYSWNRFAPYAGPAYRWIPSALPAVPGPPGQLPPPPLPPCPPGYSWCPAQLVKKPDYSPWSLGTGTGYDFYWSGGCCPADEQGIQFHCVPGDMLNGKCIPPINVPPQYNPCQPGWTYNAQYKKCCPPGWKWNPYTEQCVPI